jgi:hypothetical protein
MNEQEQEAIKQRDLMKAQMVKPRRLKSTDTVDDPPLLVTNPLRSIRRSSRFHAAYQS